MTQSLPRLFQQMLVPDAHITVLGRKGITQRASLEEIWDDAGRVAAGLIDRGLPAKSSVGVVGTSSLDCIVSALSVWRAGMVLVPIPGTGRIVSRQEWTRVALSRLRRADAKALIGGPARLDGFRSFDPSELRSEGSADVELSSDDVAVIHFSSGTTSTPKGAVQRHAAMVNRIRVRATRSIDQPQHYLNWHPLHTGAGLTASLMLPFGRGKSATIISPRYLVTDPARWLKEIWLHAITDAGGPTFLYESATAAIERGLGAPVDLSGWLTASASAELIRPSTLVRFAKVASSLGFRPEAFQTRYSSTETGAVTDGRLGSGLRIARLDRDSLSAGIARTASAGSDAVEFVSNGRPLEGVELRISDRGEELGERRIGRIEIKSGSLASGYLGETELTLASFSEGWYRSRDVGFLSEGELFITGRVEDMMVVHGANLYAHDIEGAVQAALPAVSCCAFSIRAGISEEIVLAIEIPDELAPGPTADQARTAVWGAIGVSIKDVVCLPRGELPRTPTGKLQRNLLKDRYEEGTLEVMDG